MIQLPADFRTRALARQAALDAVRQQHLPIWHDIADYVMPMRTRFLTDQKHLGDRRSHKLVDGTSLMSLRTLKAGMMSGITSPARPWFGLSPADPDLADYMPVKDYLFRSAQILRDMLLKSNLYAKLPSIYGDMAAFGTAAMTETEDAEDHVRFTHLPLGTYWIATDERERVDTLIRQVSMTARQIVRRWPQTASAEVKRMVDAGQGEHELEICQHFTRNEGWIPSAKDAAAMPFIGVWYEMRGAGDHLLGVEGFNEFPAFVPRWEKNGDDSWGFGPGVEALGDCKALQAYEIKQAKGLDQEIDPTLIGPTSMRNQGVKLLPGYVNWLPDAAMAAGGLRPIHDRQTFRIDLAQAKANEIRQRVSRAFYEDLFLMLAQSDRRQITAREIEERHQEKLLALGPVLEGLNDELLDPLIERTYAIANRRGLLPPPPEELQGVELKIEYTSIMAAAQRSVNLGLTQVFLGVAANVAQFKPEALDKIDADEVIDEVANQLGVNPRIVRSSDQVAEIRQQRAEAQAQAAAAERQAQEAKMAKDLGGIPMGGDSALDRLTSMAEVGA